MLMKMPEDAFVRVPEEEMAFAMALFVGAANGQVPAAAPAAGAQDELCCSQLFIELSDEGESMPGGAPILSSRLFSAFRMLWRQYGGQLWQRSICARVLGFYHFMERTSGFSLQEWVQPCPQDPGAVFLHPAVIETIATMALTAQGLFPPRQFLAELKLIARGYLNFADAGAGEAACPQAA